MNKQQRNRLVDKENRRMVAGGSGGQIVWLGEKGEGIEKCISVVTKQSWDAKYTWEVESITS